MKANAIPVTIDCTSILPGYQFADAYAVPAPVGMDAITAQERIVANAPGWVNVLMVLRNRLVGIFGLKTAPISAFPVIEKSPAQVLLGFDDSHLDFRIAVTLITDGQQISLTTIVRTHNWYGRTYLRLIMPFHRLIARRMAERIWQ